jgi:hypothetical protein
VPTKSVTSHQSAIIRIPVDRETKGVTLLAVIAAGNYLMLLVIIPRDP